MEFIIPDNKSEKLYFWMNVLFIKFLTVRLKSIRLIICELIDNLKKFVKINASAISSSTTPEIFRSQKRIFAFSRKHPQKPSTREINVFVKMYIEFDCLFDDIPLDGEETLLMPAEIKFLKVIALFFFYCYF